MEVEQQYLRSEFEQSGRVWFRQAISETDLSYFDEIAANQSKAGQRLSPSELLSKAFSANSSLMTAIKKLDRCATPVRVVVFNKSEKANWGVPWHQDRVIAVAQKVEISGYHNWSKKSGTWHCEPPQHILEQMMFVRVHLDNTDKLNGAMRISVGSHAKGIVPSKDAEAEALKHPIEYCDALRGDVLVLKMLTLHSSKPAKIKSGRRVLRIDFSASELPAPLGWTPMEREI